MNKLAWIWALPTTSPSPFHRPSCWRACVPNWTTRRWGDFLRDQNAYLEAEVSRRTRQLAAIQDVTILAMASLAETRDSDTGNHIRRTQHYVRALAKKLQLHPRFGYFLTDPTIDLLYKSAPLHDIGKVGIPDRILLKPGRFTPDEFEIMKTHTTLGRAAIVAAEKQLGMTVDFLSHAKDIAYYHQEKWDGSGYPEGLSWRGHSHLGAPHGGGRRVRRTHQPTRL
jgi:putative two-component system response regulator